MADNKQRARGSADDVERREAPKGAPDGTPLATTTPKAQDPGPDVSNADIDLGAVSADAAHSTYVENPDPNPNELRPAPGPSTVQVLGVPSEDAPGRSAEGNTFEETR